MQAESGAIMLYLTMKAQGLMEPQEIASITRWQLFSEGMLVRQLHSLHKLSLYTC